MCLGLASLLYGPVFSLLRSLSIEILKQHNDLKMPCEESRKKHVPKDLEEKEEDDWGHEGGFLKELRMLKFHAGSLGFCVGVTTLPSSRLSIKDRRRKPSLVRV